MKDAKLKHQLSALKEAQIMSTLRHKNVIKYHTSYMEGDYLNIIMEYADRGDLYQVSYCYYYNLIMFRK